LGGGGNIAPVLDVAFVRVSSRLLGTSSRGIVQQRVRIRAAISHFRDFNAAAHCFEIGLSLRDRIVLGIHGRSCEERQASYRRGENAQSSAGPKGEITRRKGMGLSQGASSGVDECGPDKMPPDPNNV